MIAVIGANNIDLISYIKRMPAAGETIEMKQFSIGYGGKGANQAAAAARMGAAVLMVTAVGRDLFGRQVLDNFKKYHIDTTYVKQVEHVPNGNAVILVDDSSQNRILIHKGANAFLGPDDIDKAASALAACSLIVLQLESDLAAVYKAVDFAWDHHIPVIMNPAPAVTGLDMNRVKKCEFFIPNKTELASLTGMPVQTPEEAEKAAASVLRQGVKQVIVTLGSQGSLWMRDNKSVFVPAYPVRAVDSTGAGDAYIGCFAAVYEKSRDVERALQYANAFSALSVQKYGTQTSYPSVTELKHFFHQGEQA